MYLSSTHKLLIALISVHGTLASAQSLRTPPVETSFKFAVKLGDALMNSKDYCERESEKIVDSINSLIASVQTRKSSFWKVGFVECEALGWDGAERKFSVHLQLSGLSCIHGNPASFPLKHEYRLHNWSSYSSFIRENDSAALDSLGIRFILLKDQTQLLLLPDCGKTDEI